MNAAAPESLRALGYSSGNLGKSLVWSGADLTLFFLLTEVLHFEPAAAGGIMLIALLGDVIIDLAAGRLNAYYLHRGFAFWQLLAFAAPVCAVSFAVLFSLPVLDVSSLWVTLLVLVVFRAAYGFVDIPHNAMMPSLSRDPALRARIAGMRFFFSSIGSLIVAVLLAPSVTSAGSLNGSVNLAWIGLAGALLCGTTLMFAAMSGRLKYGSTTGTEPNRISRHFLPPYSAELCRLVLLALLNGFALGAFGRMMLHYAHFVRDEPGASSSLLVAIMLGQIVGSYFWTKLAQHFSAHRTLALANLLISITVATFVFAPSSWGHIIAFCVGTALAGGFSIPWTLLSNVVEHGERATGLRHEPQAFALFLAALKLGAALSFLAIGLALSTYGGTMSETITEPTELTTAVWRLTFWPPVIGGVLCGWIAWSIRAD